jgi:hypothetical protein
MRGSGRLVLLIGVLPCACTTPSSTAASGANCAVDQALPGATYDVAKSRFAFGSTPVAEGAGDLVRWVGSDGALAIFSDGSEIGLMDGSAPESNLPDWSTDLSALMAHADAYWISMGVASCQIASTGIDASGGGGGSTDGGSVTFAAGPNIVTSARAIEGIPVVESLLGARFDVDDQTTQENFYWPEIPADVVIAAVAFKNQLSDPSALASYKAKLPANAQGQGSVVIHHTSAGSSSPFQTAATYQVFDMEPFGAALNFDPDGNLVTTVW